MNNQVNEVVRSTEDLVEVLGTTYPYPLVLLGIRRVVPLVDIPEDEEMLNIYSDTLVLDLLVPYPSAVITDDQGIIRPIASNPTNISVQVVLADVSDEDVEGLRMVVDVFSSRSDSSLVTLGNTQLLNMLVMKEAIGGIKDVIDLDKASMDLTELEAIRGTTS